MPAVTLAKFKDQLNLPTDPSSDDEELQVHLDSALGHVADKCGPLEPISVVEVQECGGASLLVLQRAPVISVEAVDQLADDAYTLDTEAGVVMLLGGRRAGGQVQVTYTAGRAVAPPALLLAVLIIAAHLWETQRVPGANQQGFGQPAAARPGSAWAVPNRAATLMAPYLLPTLP